MSWGVGWGRGKLICSLSLFLSLSLCISLGPFHIFLLRAVGLSFFGTFGALWNLGFLNRRFYCVYLLCCCIYTPIANRTCFLR